MNKQETSMGIIAEMRDLAEHRDWHNHTNQSNRERVSDLADRLEAALRRERGDCAKLREALEELMKFTCNSCERRLCEDDAEEEDGQIVSSPCSAIIEARNTLTAPPRNCDRFGGDNAKLQKVYYSECGKEYEPQDPNSRQAYLVGYGNWLLTPATEKEGDAK